VLESDHAAAASGSARLLSSFLPEQQRPSASPPPLPVGSLPPFVGALKSPEATATASSSISLGLLQPVADIFIAYAAMPGQLAYGPNRGDGVDGCSFFTQGLLRGLAVTPPLHLVQLCSAADRHLRALIHRVVMPVQQVWIECTPSEEVVRLGESGRNK
jgi:hypothetical protein